MVDLIDNICELGVLETVGVLQEIGSDSIPDNFLNELPILPSTRLIDKRIETIRDAIIASGKQEILLLSPEIALLEQFSHRSDIHFQIVLPNDIDNDMLKRVCNNVPPGVNVDFINELFFPKDFFPSNGLILAFGFQNDNRCLLLSHILRIMEHYKGFMGKRVFVTINEDGEKCSRPSSWIECYKGEYFDEQY